MNILTWLTPVFGAAALVSAVVSGLIWGTVKNLRETNDDLRKSRTDMRETIVDLQGRLTVVESERNQALVDRETLKRLVSGEVHWEALSDLQNHHHIEAVNHWDEQRTVLTRQCEKLDEIVGLLGQLIAAPDRGAL